ncbi:MAG: hypothetical protein R3349_01965, partial [Geminicoccaceae bacterium]|nr:hypothetical protein [Geminicoccaceae bacterium]
MHRVGLVGALLALVAACAGIVGEGWTLAGEPGLMTKVRQYYSQHATEEAGQCPWPIMEGVTRETVLEDNEERLEVLIRYRYRDFVRDEDDDCSRFRPNRCFIMAPCRGFAERSFTIARTDGGPAVIEMSGEQRHRRE